MRKIYKSAFVVAAMAFASVAVAQTTGTTYSGITVVKYQDGKVVVTTDYPKANYVVKVGNKIVGRYSDKYTPKASSHDVTISLTETLAAGTEFTVGLEKVAPTGVVPTISTYSAKYNDVEAVLVDVKVGVLGNVITIIGENVTSVSATNVGSPSVKVSASGASVQVPTPGVYSVEAVIDGNTVVTKAIIVE